jgi:hypothetical protein
MTEDYLQSEGPDWPAELIEPVAKLGKPTAVFRTSPNHASRRILLGLGMILGGIVANYLYWVEFAIPPIPTDFLLLLLVGAPLSGCALIYTAWRDRGLWVLAYPMGLLRWQRGQVVSFPWSEIETVSFVRVTRCETLNGRVSPEGERQTAWLPWDQTGSKILGAYLEVTRFDGITAILPTALNHFDDLNRIVQEEQFQALWALLRDDFIAGKEIKFGEWMVNLEGLWKNNERLKWQEFQLASVDSGKVVIRAQGKWRPWAETPLYLLPNPHLFLAMIEMGPPKQSIEDPGAVPSLRQ